MADPRKQLPRCPRCGYDLSGVQAPAAEKSATARTCSECGQQYDWLDVTDPTRPVRGFVEHVPWGTRRVTGAAWRTLAWTLYPAVFWGRVTVFSPVVRHRWILWAVAILLPVHFAASAFSNALVFILPPGAGIGVDRLTPTQILNGWTYPFAIIDVSGSFRARSLVTGFPAFVWCGLAACGAAWALVLALWETRRLAGVSAAHVHRAGVYSLGWIAGLAVFRALRNFYLLSAAMMDPIRGGGRTVYRLDSIDTPYIAVPLVAWVALWWLFTLKDGWRLGGWGPVWFAVALAGSLAALFPAVWEQEIRWLIIINFPRW